MIKGKGENHIVKENNLVIRSFFIKFILPQIFPKNKADHAWENFSAQNEETGKRKRKIERWIDGVREKGEVQGF